MSIRERFARYVPPGEPDRSMEIDEEPVSSYIRATMLDAIQSVNPSAVLQSSASIRITGDRFESGYFDIDAASIFDRVDKEIRAAAPPSLAESFRLGFRTVIEGSVILPLEAFEFENEEVDTLPLPVPAAVETAFIRVMDLHNALESGEQVDGFGESLPSGLIHQLRMLIEALDQVDAGLEIKLSGSTGHQRISRLTQHGRERARRVFERRSEVTQHALSGHLIMVAVKDEFARIELKNGKSPKIEIHQVPTQIAKRLSWDSLLRFTVRTETVTDQFGERKTVRHEFLEQIQQGVLPDV